MSNPITVNDFIHLCPSGHTLRSRKDADALMVSLWCEICCGPEPKRFIMGKSDNPIALKPIALHWTTDEDDLTGFDEWLANRGR